MLRGTQTKPGDIFLSLIDFFLPRFCPSCSAKLLVDEDAVCNNCLSNIQRASQERLQHEYERKFSCEKIIGGFASVFVFEKDKELQHVIHALKYNGKFSLGSFLGRLVANKLGNQIAEWNIDLIVPVPLHHLKRAERGYNQSEFLARGMKSVLKIPVKGNLIKRNRFTETQTTLSLDQRRENVKDAFAHNRKVNITNKNILLIDDVITTGATTAECGRLLLNNGAAKVYAASVAIAD